MSSSTLLGWCASARSRYTFSSRALTRVPRMQWRTRAMLLVAILAVILVAAWFVVRPPSATGTRHEARSPAREEGQPAQRDGRPRSAAGLASRRSERNALRERIVQALRTPTPAQATEAAAPSRPVNPPAAGQLRDRIGGKDLLVRSLNELFMPLAKECIAQTEQRDPLLSGVLAIDVEIVADEALGGVIDRAEGASANQVADEDLVECVRQSAMSVILPTGLITGHEKFSLTFRVGPDPDAGD